MPSPLPTTVPAHAPSPSPSGTTVRLEDAVARPWRNGGGTTRELLAHPDGDAWRVRVSVADVVADGPFSSFPGVVRWFAVIEGDGVLLSVDGVEHRCTEGGAPLAFDGGAQTHSRLVGGPTRDLNLMLRDVRGGMDRVVAGEAFRPTTIACGLYASASGRVRTDDGRADESMPAAALRWWPRAPARLGFDGAGWWLSADVAAA